MFIILSLINGAVSFVNMILASKVAKESGMVKGIFYNFFWATVASLIAYFIFESNGDPLISLNSFPLVYLVGGVLGILINFIFNIAIPMVSSVYIVVIRFIGQLFLGALIDYYYFDMFSLGKILGLLFFLLGLVYNSYIDSKQNF